MNISLAGKRALVAFASVSLVATGVVVANSPVIAPLAHAQEGRTSIGGATPRGDAAGIGDGTLQEPAATVSGGQLTITGTGFKPRTSDGAFIGMRINERGIAWPRQQGEGKDVDGDLLTLTGSNLPDANGNFSATVTLPELAPGDYWIRVLAGQDEDAAGTLSKYVWFTVTDGTTTQAAPSVTASTRGETADVSASGFAPGAEVSVTVDGKPAKFGSGRRATETVKANASGAVRASVGLGDTPVLAGETAELVLKSGDAEAKTTITGSPQVAVDIFGGDLLAGKTPALGSTAKITVTNVPAGTTLTGIDANNTNILNAPVSTQKVTRGEGDNQVTVDEIVAEGVNIPNNADLLFKTLKVIITLPNSEERVTFDTGIQYTPSTAKFGADKFNIDQTFLPSGLYQTAYSEKQNAIYVTRSVGRPPIKESTLYKLNADTLEIEKEITPEATTHGRGGLFAVYGVGVDEKNDLVWITNTRQDTISVYDAKTLELKKQWEPGAVHHARDVIVDQQTGKAYVSSPRTSGTTNGHIYVFDGADLNAEAQRIDIPNFVDTMSLDIDPKTGDLYTVSLVSPKVAKIETRNNKITVWDFDEDEIVTGSGVAYDGKNNRVHVSSQGSANNLVIDASTGRVIKNIPTGAGALNSEYSAKDNVVYVSNFGADTITVIDADSLEVIANIDGGGPRVNHVASGKDGVVYAVNKADVNNEAGEQGFNQLTRLSLKEAPAPAPDPQPDPTPDPQPDPQPDPDDDRGSSGSSNPVVTGLGITAGIVAALAAAAGFLIHSGVIPAHVLPPQVRAILGL